MSYNPKGKWLYLAPLNVRSEAVEGGSIPEDEMQCDFIISNNEEDSYGSVMTEKTLRNYAEDAASGRVPFMLDHGEGTRNQLGNIIAANYDEAEKQVVATARLLRDTDGTPDHMKVNEYIRRIERGFYNQCSVGFRDATEKCNMSGCGKEIFDFHRTDPCPHIPKRTYDGVKCTYSVDDARLREVSLVATGSNPNAKLLDTRAWDADHQQIKQTGETTKDAPDDKQTLLERDGLKYREQLITKAVAEGVRAEDDFDEQKWRERFKTMEADTIIDQTTTWQRLGDSRWGSGGRVTGDPTTHQDTNGSVLILPTNVFNY